MRQILSLAPDAYARRQRWIFAALAVGAVVWGATDVRSRGRIDPNDVNVHKTDFTCFTEAGAAFFDGRDPYHVKNVRGWGYPYPPLFALCVAPLAQCDPQLQITVWYALSVLMCFGCYWESRKLWRKFSQQSQISDLKSEIENRKSKIENPPSPFLLWLPWLSALTVALPVLNCLQRGQVGIMKAYLLLLGLRLLIDSYPPLPLGEGRGEGFRKGASWRRALGAGIVLSLPIVLKVTPVLPVGVLLFGLVVQSLSKRHKILPLPLGEGRGEGFTVKLGKSQSSHESTTLTLALSQRERGQIALGTFSGVAAGLVLFVLLIPSAILGWEANERHLTTWYREVATRANDLGGADRTGNTRTIRNQSFSNAVFRAGNWVMYEFAGGPNDMLADDDQHYVRGMLPMDSASVEKTLFVLRLGLIGLVGLGMARMAWRSDTLGLAAMFGLATAATIIVAPLGRGHYFMLLLPAIYLVPLWFWQRGETRWAWTASLVPLALCVVHYVALDIAGRAGILGIGTTIWYAAVTGKMLVASNKTKARSEALPEEPSFARLAA